MPSDTRRVTCDDCFFRRQLLCALRLPEPCPTFRRDSRAGLMPPPQASLVAPRVVSAPLGTLSS
jgi:hypothetical protein